MKIAVKDANVFIDLIQADLLGLWFGLGIETHTTDLVLHEINEPAQCSVVEQFVAAKLLIVHPLTSVEMDDAGAFSQKWRMSATDASVVLLANRLNAALLSGDGTVRRAAQSLTIDVRGVLWILDLLVKENRLAPLEAKRRLLAIKEAGGFLPSSECEARIRRWGGT